MIFPHGFELAKNLIGKLFSLFLNGIHLKPTLFFFYGYLMIAVLDQDRLLYIKFLSSDCHLLFEPYLKSLYLLVQISNFIVPISNFFVSIRNVIVFI